MAKKAKDLEETIEPTVTEEVPEVKEVVEVAPPKQLISFNLWFANARLPARRKVGMQAFTNTNIRRTKEEWDKIFSTY